MIKPILIPTGAIAQPDEIALNNTSGEMFIMNRRVHNAWQNVPGIGNCGEHLLGHHIGIIDTEAKIVEGDLYLHHGFTGSHALLAAKTGDPKVLKALNESDCVKIISSTIEEHHLPQLSEQSVELLFEYYNVHSKMPESVEVIKDVMDININNFVSL